MIKRLILATLIIINSTLAIGQDKIINPATLTMLDGDSIRTIEPRTQFYTFGLSKEFATGSLENSHFYQELDSKWKYKLYSSKEQIENGVTTSSFDDSSWSSYAVNSGKDISNSTAIKRAKGDFKVDLPAQNPAAVYRTTFKVPMTWDERQVFFSAENLSTNSTIYVNGIRVGYSEDSKAISGFDITGACKEGLNSLTIITYGYSAASYLEDGNQYAGMQIGGRAVIWSAPKVQLYDYTVNTTFDPTYKNGLLEVGAVVSTHYLNVQDVKLFFELRDADGKVVDSQSKMSKLNMRTRDTVFFNVPIKDVNRWDESDPYIYRATLKVQREMRFTEFVTIPIGFRQIDITDGVFMVNGRKEKIKGVKLSNKEIPHSITKIRELFGSLKERGINSLWITGAQNDSLYTTADEVGLYIFSAANINSSSDQENLRYGLGNNRFLVEKYLSRQLNNYEAAKSHPSVVSFLMGGEGSNGYNMYESYILLEEKNSLRPIAYQGGNGEWNSDLMLPQNVDLKYIESYENSAGIPAIVSISKAKNIKNIWGAALKNNSVGGIFFDNIALFESNNASQYFGGYTVSVNREIITITNNSLEDINSFTIDYTLNHDRLSITVADFTLESKKSPTTAGSFAVESIKAGKSASFEIDKKIFKAVESVDIILTDSKGYIEYRGKIVPAK